ncbi:MAG TPA: 1,6-anhydro-N-acetylmuramyl-L-alanine amidase AmpD [Burkholderiales bacterium]|nr:1,6-anhydro-N-acetylmuramyl-L-alanine amidase AmpD [Burkholderiales bacterium]
MRISHDGLADDAQFIASPNCDERPPATDIELIVVHAISLPPGIFGGPGIVQLFTNSLDATAHPYYATVADLRVSAHFLVRRDGNVIQFVPTRLRAWHAGVSCWRGRERCNDFSVGIELEGCDEVPFEDAQYASLARLTRATQDRHPIGQIVGHSEIAPGRKTDPGPHFDWLRYRRLLS